MSGATSQLRKRKQQGCNRNIGKIIDPFQALFLMTPKVRMNFLRSEADGEICEVSH
jgi:hypothetical protein